MMTPKEAAEYLGLRPEGLEIITQCTEDAKAEVFAELAEVCRKKVAGKSFLLREQDRNIGVLEKYNKELEARNAELLADARWFLERAYIEGCVDERDAIFGGPEAVWRDSGTLADWLKKYGEEE